MAIYRSDQAVVTFGTEAAPGGYPELAYPTETDPSGFANTNLSGAHPAGSRSLSVDAGDTFAIGDYVSIGYNIDDISDAGIYNAEIRRVMGTDIVSGVDRLYLDAPTGFHHVDNAQVREVDTAPAAGPVVRATYPLALSNTTKYSNAMRFVPGIYDTVEVGDMTTTYNPVYALGSTAKRSPTFIYRGEQAFTGAISGMTLLNGWPLRFGIGKITTKPSDDASPGSMDTQLYDGSPLITWKKGDQVIDLNDAEMYAAVIDDHGTPGSNYNLIYIKEAGSEEVVQVYKKGIANKVFLTHPLRFDHISSTANPFTCYILNSAARTYTHTIVETSDLDSIAMNVHLRDSGETADNDFNRRYYGGHIGTSVIAAEEQGLVTTSWDGIQFMGMVHNQQFESGFASAGTGAQKYLPRHAFMKTISDTEAWVPSNGITSGVPLGVAAKPYYFSQGSITLYDVPIATIRSFSLTINNNPEARYYISSNAGQRQRGPYEIVNQRRDYALTMTVVEPTSRAIDVATASTAGYEQGGSSVFKQMLMEGDAGGLTTATPEGLSFEIQFSRDDLGTTSTDYIKITPSYATGDSPAFGLSTQGMFISSAKFNLDGSSPIQADLEIMLRNVEIEIEDTTPIYP